MAAPWEGDLKAVFEWYIHFRKAFRKWVNYSPYLKVKMLFPR